MGRYVKVGDTLESVYGTEPGGQTYTGVRSKTVSQTVDRGIMFEENIEHYLAATGYGGALKLGGTLEGSIRPLQMKNLFYGLMGNRASATTPGDPLTGWKYTFDVPKSIDIKTGESTAGGSVEWTYKGVGVKSCSLNFAAKEFVTGRFEWLAQTATAGSYSAPSSYTSEEPLVFYAATVTLDAVTSTKIKSLTMDIDRKLDDDRFVVGDYKLTELGYSGMTEVGGSLTFTEQEYGELKRAQFGTTTGTSLDARNLVGGPVLKITCTDLSAIPVTKMVIQAGVSIYGNADYSMSGQDEAERKVDYKVIGSSFTVYTVNS